MITLAPAQNKVSHGTLRVPWLTLGLSILVTLLHFFHFITFQFLVFDKEAILRGEVWRFFTGHFVHFGFDHFAWDLLALIILGAIIEFDSPKKMAESLLIACGFVSILLMAGGSGYDTYCGLSGALSGLLVVAVFVKYQATKNKMLFGVLIAMILKILFEAVCQRTLFVTAVTPVHTAHIAGFLSGFCYWALKERKSHEK